MQESTQQQVRQTFEESGSTVQLHRFLKADAAAAIAGAMLTRLHVRTTLFSRLKRSAQDSTQEQVRQTFEESGSTVQLHRFLKADVAVAIADAMRAADAADNLGYMEAAPFDVGVRGGWKPVGPPHRHR